jgi:hypothetical protein
LLGGFAHIIRAVRFKFRPTFGGSSKLNSGNAGNLPEPGEYDQPDFGANLLKFARRRFMAGKIFPVATAFMLC